MAAPKEKKHILAINESEEVLELMRELLEEEEYRVSTQRYVAKDFEEVIEFDPDVIILDYMWHTDDAGWSFLQMLKLNPAARDIPIVLCTGALDRVREHKPHLDEMRVRLVFKPFNIEELLGEISRALDT